MDDTQEPEQIRLDARNLRGIAHPVRVRMLGMLRVDGPATATTLAHRLGLNTGATSYHLRQLAEHGFIVEDPDLGTRRERWWKAAQMNTTVTDDDLFTDDTGLGVAYLRSVIQVSADKMLQAVDALPTMPERWRAAQDFSDYLFAFTPEQAEDLVAEIHTVLKRHRVADPRILQEPPEGTARVTFQFQMFPHPEDVGARDNAATDDRRPREDDTPGEGR